jgi:hypothetical protein
VEEPAVETTVIIKTAVMEDAGAAVDNTVVERPAVQLLSLVKVKRLPVRLLHNMETLGRSVLLVAAGVAQAGEQAAVG